MDDDDYQSHDAVGLAALVRDRSVSAQELLEAARSRAAEVNDRINAVVVEVDPPRSGSETGPFAGVPFLLKDLGHDLEGYPTSGGSRSLATTPATENATVVQRWLDAGLVVFGKTNTPEFGAKGVTESHLFGPARNPWNPTTPPAVPRAGRRPRSRPASCPARRPATAAARSGSPPRRAACSASSPRAGWCPLVRWSREGLGGTATNGVVSRSVRDTAAMLDVLVGGTPDGPYLPALPATSYADEVGQDPGPLRIGLCTASAINPKPHAEAVAAATGAGQLLESLGHEVEQLDSAPFDDEALAKDFLTTWFVYAADSVAQAKAFGGSDDSGFEPDTLIMAALGRATNPVDLVRAIENRQAHVRRLAEFHESFDLLLTPSTALPPPKIGALDLPAAIQKAQKALVKVRGAGLLRFTPVVDQLISENLGWVPYTQLANLTGRPAMSVPLHWTADGLPIGAQLVGRLGSDGLLLRLAAQLEQAQPWADRRPAL